MTLLVIIHIAICGFLIFVILMQPGKGDAGVSFGSSTQSIFGSKAASNFLTKTTSVCAVLFLLTSFILTKWRIREYEHSVIMDSSIPLGTSGSKPPSLQKKPGDTIPVKKP